MPDLMPAATLDMPEFGPSLPIVVYNSIRKAIVDGVFQPGEAVRQQALARLFSVSRVPVREALSRLEAEGLLVQRPRRGYVVKELDIGEVVEIFEMRAVMEEHAAYVATQRRTDTDIQEVRALLERLQSLSGKTFSKAPQWVKVNHQFHNRIFKSSRRAHLCQAIDNYRDRVDGYIRIEVAMTGRLTDFHQDHSAIAQAFTDGDADLAARLSREHCMHTLENLLRILKGGDSSAAPADG